MDEIENYDKWMNAILKSYQLIRGHLEKITDAKETEKTKLVSLIKQEIGTIVNYHARLRPHCDGKGKEFIDTLREAGVIFTGYMNTDFFESNRSLITRWANEANSVSIDFSEAAWEIKGGIKARLGFLEPFIEGHYKKEA